MRVYLGKDERWYMAMENDMIFPGATNLFAIAGGGLVAPPAAIFDGEYYIDKGLGHLFILIRPVAPAVRFDVLPMGDILMKG